MKTLLLTGVCTIIGLELFVFGYLLIIARRQRKLEHDNALLARRNALLSSLLNVGGAL
jgi:hypothetical protein